MKAKQTYTPSIRWTLLLILSLFLNFHAVFVQAQRQEKGKITGKVVSAGTGETVIGANIVVTGTARGDATDLDGRYTIRELTPGLYSITVSYVSFTSKTITGVEVVAGGVTKLNVTLQPETMGLDEITVTAEASSNSEAGLLSIQRKSTAVQDGLSSEYLGKTGDSNVADAMKRVTGVTLLNGKDVFVRGLGNRYSNIQLNGARLPSTSATRKEAPVDLVGSGLVDNIVVQKTFTPDQPGEFSGGSVRITTREFPESKNFSFSYSTGYNSVATFNHTPGYHGSTTDFLGFDNGKRSLPGILASQRLGTDNGMQSQVVDALHRDWMVTDEQKAIPSQKIDLNYANQFNEEKFPIGLVTNLSYKYDRSFEPGQIYREIQSYVGEDNRGGDRFLMNSDYSRNEGSENVKLSGMANLYFKPSRVTKIGFKNLYSNSLTNSSSVIEGSYINYDYTRQTIMEFDRRALFSSAIELDTYLERLNGGRLTARLGYNNAVRDRPDRRSTQYNRADQTTGPQIYFDDGGNGHFFSRQDDNNYSGELDFSLRPFERLKIKAGVSGLLKQRDFYARQFKYQNYRNLYPEEAKTLPPDRALAPEYVEQDLLELVETTQKRDSYDAEQRLLAGYLSTIWTPAHFLSMEIGARMEHSDQEVSIPGRPDPIANVDNLDLLPAANITVNVTDKTNLRGAFSKTLARPEFREISEFRFQDFLGGQIVYGNPELERTQIFNYDLRFESYPSPGELLAVSAFYKKFLKPIEIFYRFTERTEVQYRNAREADLYGIEIEARKNIVPRFQMVANASYIISETRVEEGDTGTLGVANARRPMYGQSPYTVNLNAFYTIPQWHLNLSAGYNTFGPRLVTVGVYRHNYDEYEQPFHSVHLSADYSLGPATFTLRADNLLNRQTVYRQGDLVTYRYRPGMTLDFGIKYSF